ncbi:MAG: polynucleotide adenylyltransferase [Campylobacterota bacterium]|nr:polynucleotide adenylyltransferase [Campylobacterota bacterium]
MKKKIYLVGGAVRDMLMDIPFSDKDYVAVGYKASDFDHLEKIGKDFPVFITKNNEELALARVEKKISKGYNGFETDTSNISLEDDLKRRDLTINSIAYDEQNSIFIDPYKGKDDIDNKILRHTSTAFVEDPIRVLRIARFRATFGYQWKIHHTTKVLIYNMKDELKTLQKDRVYKEIEKVLKLKNSDIFFQTLFELGVLDSIFSSIYSLTTLKEGSLYHMEDSCFIHTMMVLKNLSDCSAVLKLAALYHDIAKPICYRRYGNSSGHDKKEIIESLIDINIPTKLKKRVLFLIQNHIKIYILDEMKATKIASFFESFRKDKSLLEDLITLADADNQGRICEKTKQNLPKKKLLDIFEAISNYSPKKWIDQQNKEISSEAIKQHIHRYNISIVKKYF